VRKDLPIIFPAPTVILSTSIPHYSKYEQHRQVLKKCANIVAQFLDGMQILIYMSLNYISKFGAPVVILALSQTYFKLSGFSAQTSLAFHSDSCNISIEYKPTGT
jgi:hypothetical protein